MTVQLVIKDHSVPPCEGCSQYELFIPAEAMPKGTHVDYIWRCPVCSARWAVTGAPGALSGRMVARHWWQR